MNMPIQQNAYGPGRPAAPIADLEDFFRSIGFRPTWREAGATPEMRLDIRDDGAGYRIEAEIPGVEKNDIELSIDGNQVSISVEVKRADRKGDEKELHVERSYGRTRRVFALPVDVDAGAATASYDRGILSVVLPKSVAGQTRRIAIS